MNIDRGNGSGIMGWEIMRTGQRQSGGEEINNIDGNRKYQNMYILNSIASIRIKKRK